MLALLSQILDEMKKQSVIQQRILQGLADVSAKANEVALALKIANKSPRRTDT